MSDVALRSWHIFCPSGFVPGDVGGVGGDNDLSERDIDPESKYAEVLRPATSEAADASVLRVRLG